MTKFHAAVLALPEVHWVPLRLAHNLSTSMQRTICLAFAALQVHLALITACVLTAALSKSLSAAVLQQCSLPSGQTPPWTFIVHPGDEVV